MSEFTFSIPDRPATDLLELMDWLDTTVCGDGDLTEAAILHALKGAPQNEALDAIDHTIWDLEDLIEGVDRYREGIRLLKAIRPTIACSHLKVVHESASSGLPTNSPSDGLSIGK
jgi:hypothetical protein